MKTFNEYVRSLRESILDPRHPTLSKDIWDTAETPTLRTAIRTQIVQCIRALEHQAGVKVVSYRLIGSILTHRYSIDSDLDVNVLIRGDMNRAMPVAQGLSGHRAGMTRHPINFHVLTDRILFDRANRDADGVFNVEANIFERIPLELKFDVRMYWTDFKRIATNIDFLSGRLKDLIVNYEHLKRFPAEDLHYLRQNALEQSRQIMTTTQQLMSIYDTVWKNRNDIFARPLSAQELLVYGQKNRTPQNVIYKLLERYHYLDLLHHIWGIVGNHDSLTEQEIHELELLFLKPSVKVKIPQS